MPVLVQHSHLNLVDGLPHLQSLAPHRDTPLVVSNIPAFLTQTLRLEAGERPVVRDGHSASRHGLLPGKGGRSAGVQETPVGPRGRHSEEMKVENQFSSSSV